MSDYKGDRKHNYTARNRLEGGGDIAGGQDNP